MTSTAPGLSEPTSWLARLGIPRLAGAGRFVSATAIDSIGTGLVTTFILIYFAKTTSLTLPAVGGAMTLARLLASPTALAVGPLLDRFGARAMAATGNIASAIGFFGFLVAHSLPQVVVVVLLVQVGQATYWTSSSALVVLAATETNRTQWFGFVHALRNAGLGIGGALGSVWLLVGDVSGLHGIILGNAASCVMSAVLLVSWRPNGKAAVPAAHDSAAPAARASYAVVLRDRRYLLLLAINVTFVFAALLINVLLAIYIVIGLRQEAWIAGTLLVLAAVQVSVTQTFVSKHLDRYRATRTLIVASLLNIVSFTLYAVLDVTPAWMIIPGLFLATVVLTIGETVSAAPSDNLSVTLAPEHARGRYLAIYQLSWTFGQIAAPGLFAFLLAREPVLPLLFLVLLSVVALPMLLVLERMIERSGPAVAVPPAHAVPVAPSAFSSPSPSPSPSPYASERMEEA